MPVGSLGVSGDGGRRGPGRPAADSQGWVYGAAALTPERCISLDTGLEPFYPLVPPLRSSILEAGKRASWEIVAPHPTPTPDPLQPVVLLPTTAGRAPAPPVFGPQDRSSH